MILRLGLKKKLKIKIKKMSKNYIGKILSTDTLRHNRALHNWNNKIIPALNSVIAVYNSLELKEKFNNDTLKDVLANKTKNIKKDYLELMNLGVKELPKAVSLAFGNIENKVDEIFKPLDEAIKKLFESFNDASAFSPMGGLPIEFEDIEIKDGKPELKLEQLKKRFQVIIEKESQSDFYSAFLDLQKAWDKAVGIVKDNSDVLDRFPFLDNGKGFVYEDNEAKLSLDEKMIELL
jgi:hypothetical protein